MTTRALIALGALAVAFAWPMQVTGYNQNAHYALIRALAVHGKPSIDESLREIGEVSTRDTARFEGHWYAAKAPGLAVASLPAFAVVEAARMRTTGDPMRVLWVLHLWSLVLPALGIVVLVWRLGDRLEPGYGAAAAIAAGVATLVLPFSTLFFSHVLAGALGFAAFALLAYERRGPPRNRVVALAGVLSGLAVFVEYPLALGGALVGLYAMSRGAYARRALAYAGGVVVGVLPLLAFNQWAFGSPFHIAYEDYYDASTTKGLFGFGLPSASHANDLLFSVMGLGVLTPIVLAGAVGAALWLRPHRAEAITILGLVGVYFLWNTSQRYASPFGGLGPPRYLFPLVPFAALGVAAAFRRFPVATGTLMLVSAFQMAVTTATGPLAAYDGDWMTRVRAKQFVATAASVIDVTGWYAIVPFLLASAVAAVAALASVPRPANLVSALAVGAVAALAWAGLAALAHNPSGRTLGAGYVLSVAITAALTAAVTTLRPWAFARRPAASPRTGG